MLAGACAGFVTAFLQTKLGVPSILAGIVTNTGLYTVNLMAMGWKSNQSLLGGKTVFTMLRETGIGGEWYEPAARSVCHASGRSSAGAVSRHAHGSFHPRHGR